MVHGAYLNEVLLRQTAISATVTCQANDHTLHIR